MTEPVLIFGPVVSTYVRIVQIVCEEAGLSHEVVPTPAHSPDNRHPFGKVPVVHLDGHEMYETASVANYIDAAHNRGALQPSDPLLRSVSERWVGIANSYLFPLFEHGLVMPYVMHRYAGEPLDTKRISDSLPGIAKTLSFLDFELQHGGAWTRCGFSMADIFLYAVLRGVQLTPQGAAGIAQMNRLPQWMEECRARPSIAATAWPMESGSAAS